MLQLFSDRGSCPSFHYQRCVDHQGRGVDVADKDRLYEMWEPNNEIIGREQR